MNYVKVKNRSYANRGMTLEELITLANTRYKLKGKAIIEKQNTKFIPIRNAHGKVVNCKVESKSTVDYIGRYGDIPVAFEAKNTNINRIQFSAVKDHQARFLDQWIENTDTAVAMVIVAFEQMSKFYAIPWPFWKKARDLWQYQKGKRETVIYDGQLWVTPGKASVSPEELLPKWEVKLDHEYGLPYLNNINT